MGKTTIGIEGLMVTAQDMIRGMDALEAIINEMTTFQKDAVLFIAEKNLHKEFLEYHAEQHLKRTQAKQ